MSVAFFQDNHTHALDLLPELVLRPWDCDPPQLSRSHTDNLRAHEHPRHQVHPHRQEHPRRQAAVVALSASLGARLLTRHGPVSWEQLYHLPGSTMLWWNRAAENVLRAINHRDAALQFRRIDAVSGTSPTPPLRVSWDNPDELQGSGQLVPDPSDPTPYPVGAARHSTAYDLGAEHDAGSVRQLIARHAQGEAVDSQAVYEVVVPGSAPAKDWLAHPSTMSLLHDAACRLFPTGVQYLVMGNGKLLCAARISGDTLIDAATWADARPLVCAPIEFGAGFPVVVGSDAPPPSPQLHPVLLHPFRSLTKLHPTAL